MTDETADKPLQTNGEQDKPQAPAGADQAARPFKIEPPPQRLVFPTPPRETAADAPDTQQRESGKTGQPDAPSGSSGENAARQEAVVPPAPPPVREERERRDEGPRRNERRERGRSERNEGPAEKPGDTGEAADEGGERTERQERSGRSDRPERSDRQERSGRTDRSGRSDRSQRSQRADGSGRPARAERSDRPARSPRTERSPRSDRPERSSDPRSSRGGRELSVVIPVYNEEGSLRELYDNIRSGLGRTQRYEIIFVDDGSTDGSARVLAEIHGRDRQRVKVIRFRRNYGKSAALSVGFREASGEIVVTMDSDLQDDPAEIPSLMNEIRKGYDLVSGWKKKRRDPITKTIPSRFFNFVTSMMTGVRLHDINCGLKAYRNEVVKEINVYGELHRYIPVLAHGLGFKLTEIPVTHHRRKYGKTKFGIGRFWKGFLDLITVMFTTRYLRRPLHLFGFWGIVFFLAGFGIDAYLGYLKFTEGQPLSNRPLFLGGVLLIIVGVQFISIGLLGEMIIKTKSESSETYSIREMLK